MSGTTTNNRTLTGGSPRAESGVFARSLTNVRFGKFGRLRASLSLVTVALAVTGCNIRQPVTDDARITATTVRPSFQAGEMRSVAASDGSVNLLALRLAAINDAVGRWRSASDLRVAHAAAEEARNLVVGPTGPYYGDADRNGAIAGRSNIGLLPGRAGQPGLARHTDGACVVRDILGGDWEQPAQRWSLLETAIKEWSPSTNTFPRLRSHPQRIAGWATLTLASKQVSMAREFGSHAQIHSTVSRGAVGACKL